MSFPDPNSFTPPPFTTNEAGDYWSSFVIPNNEQPGLIPPTEGNPSMNRPRMSENPVNFAPYPPMNPRPNNVPVNRGTSNIFYKTRICAKFMEGMCRNGEHCTFAHGAEDLREPPPNWQELIREKERGGNNVNFGDDQRMIHRMKICKKYYNGEECPYGDKCNFLHEREPGLISNKFKADVSGQRESNAIRLGVTSDSRGSRVDVDQMGSWKTKICGKWEMGQCPYRERCSFAHGQSELKTSSGANEVNVATNTRSSVPLRAHSVASFAATPTANLATFAPPCRDLQTDDASRWKLTRRVNRIYGDWLDDGSPPHGSSDADE